MASGQRHLVCPSGCRGGRFEILGAPVLVDRTGRYLEHSDREATFRCAECQAVAVDLAAAASARARDSRDAQAFTLTCPGCGERLLPPADHDPGSDLECPGCGLIFSWEEGSRSLLGQYSEEEPGQA